MKKLIALALVFVCALSVVGCNAQESDSNIPKDFSFALRWGCYGQSSYDSKTGKLIKTNFPTNSDKYVTYYELSNEDKEYIYNLLQSLDVNSYPDDYHPDDGLISLPTVTLVLTVRVNGEEKTIRTENTHIPETSKNEKGKKFISACETIRDMLTSTEEWKALPDYEVNFD